MNPEPIFAERAVVTLTKMSAVSVRTWLRSVHHRDPTPAELDRLGDALPQAIAGFVPADLAEDDPPELFDALIRRSLEAGIGLATVIIGLEPTRETLN
jgi:hypothetical protein